MATDFLNEARREIEGRTEVFYKIRHRVRMKRIRNDHCTQLSPRVEREIVFEFMAKSNNFERGFFFFHHPLS